MPVALPQADEENLQPPDAAEARLIAGGVAAAVAVDGELAGLQRLMIEALTESMTGLADAMRRGALSAALGVPEKDPRAIGAGSVTPWEPGGISPYQYDAGRKAAGAAGRAFDSYGATPTSPGAASPLDG